MDFIQKFMLPRVTEKLYEKEAISSIHLTKEVADKINELVDAYNYIAKERLTNYQTVNGRIDKLVLFVQDNLYNTCLEMFKVMEHSGEWKQLIDTLLPQVLSEELTYYATDAERIDGVSFVTDVRYPYGHVNRYGAKGDGIFDDTDAINNAAAICRNTGYALICNDGEYKVSSDLDLTFVPKIVFKGDIICDEGVFVHVGNSGYNHSGSDIEFGNVTNLKISGLKNSKVSFNCCDFLYCYANGDTDEYSTAYSTFTGNFCNKVELFSEGENIGWINENTFNIRRINEITIGGNYDHNNNHFPHCNMEHGVLNLYNARNNHFSCRGENGITINDDGNNEINMIEAEYFYKYDFGTGPEETNNHTIKHFGITAIQTEKVLLDINKFNRQHPMNAMCFEGHGWIRPISYGQLFNSGMVELNQNIAIKFESDDACLRCGFKFHDAGGNIVKDESLFTCFGVQYDEENGEYFISANQAASTLHVYKSDKIKYITYRLYFGNDVENWSVKYVRLKLIKLTNTPFEMYNQIKFNTYDYEITKGYWNVGDIVRYSNLNQTSYVARICVQEGVPGRWRNIGLLYDYTNQH